MSTSPALAAFQKICHEYYTCFVFASTGMEKAVADIPFDPVKYPEQKLYIGHGHPDQVPSQAVIAAARLVYVVRKDGEFQSLIGKALLCLLYAAWDEYYRHAIAAEYEVPGTNVKSPLMGELRLVRQWIVHKKSVVQPNLNKLVLIPWVLSNGELLQVSSTMFRQFIDCTNHMQVEIVGVSTDPQQNA